MGVVAALCIALVATACGDGESTQRTVPLHRTIRDSAKHPIWTSSPPSSDHRFPNTAETKHPFDLLDFKLPAKWQAKRGTSNIVIATFVPPRPAGDTNPPPRITLSFAHGSLLDNLNRWRGQLGLEPVEAAAATSLPKVPYLGKTAYLVDLEGETFRGMGHGAEVENARLIALMPPPTSRAMLFFKMVGTQEQVRPLKDSFLDLAASIGLTPQGPYSQESGTRSQSERKPNESPQPYRWDVPDGWKQLKPAAYALASFAPTGKSIEATCSISQFRGDVGGLNANVARWCKQVGIEPLSDEAISKLPTLTVLGRAVPYLQLRGEDKADPQGQAAKSPMIVAVYCDLGGSTLVAKLAGFESYVEAHKDAFEALVTSIEEVQ